MRFSLKSLGFLTTSLIAFSSIKTNAITFSGFYSFGDSLSDMGNIFAATQSQRGNGFIDPLVGFVDFQYFNGRFGGGPLWHERLAPLVGTASTLDMAFAYGGATTRDQFTNGTNFNLGIVPGVRRQIDIFFSNNKNAFNQAVSTNIATLNPNAFINNVFQNTITNAPNPRTSVDPNAVYSIWAGINNYRALNRVITPLNLSSEERTARFEAEVDVVINDLRTAMTRLKNAGARYFIVGNAPGITAQDIFTPVNRQLTEEDRRAAVGKHNTALNDMLREFAKDKNVRIIPLDTFNFGEEIKANPAEFGFTEVNVPVKEFAARNGGRLPSNLDEYLFWDELGHLTERGNRVLANYVFEIIRAPESLAPIRAAVRQNLLQQDRLLQHRLSHIRGSSFDVPSVAAAFADTCRSLRPQGQSFYFTLADVQKANYRPLHQGGSMQNQGPALYSLPHFESDEANPFGIFVSGDLSFAKRRASDTEAGARVTTEVVTAGMDYMFNKNYRAGVAMHYTNGNTKINESLGRNRMNGYAISLFGSAKFGNFHADVIGTHGWQHHTFKRRIPLLNRQANSKPISKSRSVGLYGGYDYKCGDLKVTPTASLRYGTFDIHDFSETGAQNLNMFVHKQLSKTFIGSVGGEVGYSFETEYGKFTPKLRGSYEHDFEKDNRTLVTELLTLKGVPTRSTLAPKDTDWGRIGGGIDAEFSKRSTLSLDYEAFIGVKRYSSHTIFAKFRHRF